MKFMLLIYGPEDALAGLDEVEMKTHMGEYFAYDDELAAIGALVGGEPLEPTATAKTVATGGLVTDGPFAETAEVLGGYYVIDVADQAAALEWAARIPGVVHGYHRAEVRAIIPMSRA